MVIIPDAQGQLTPQSQLIQAFMVVLITCKNEEDPSLPARIKKIQAKMKALEWSQL